MKMPTFLITSGVSTNTSVPLACFDNRKEFDIEVISGKTYWHSLKVAIQSAKENNHNYVIICTDNHQFTDNYYKDYLLESIEIARKFKTKILLGGWNGFDSMLVQVNKEIYWIDNISKSYFFVIFDVLYDQILWDTTIDQQEPLEKILSDLTSNKLLMFPFISQGRHDGNFNPVLNKITRIGKQFERIAILRSNLMMMNWDSN